MVHARRNWKGHSCDGYETRLLLKPPSSGGCPGSFGEMVVVVVNFYFLFVGVTRLGEDMEGLGN